MFIRLVRSPLPFGSCRNLLPALQVSFCRGPGEDLEFLHKDLGITEGTLREVCSQSLQLLKLREGIFCHPSLAGNLVNNLEVVKELNLNYYDEKDVVLNLARLLVGTEAEKLRKTVKWYIKKLDVDMNDLAKIVVQYPQILKHSIEEEVLPLWDMLEEAGIDKVGLRYVISKNPWIVGFQFDACTPLEMVQSLREFGLSKKDAQWMMLRAPEILKGTFQETIVPTIRKLRSFSYSKLNIQLLMTDAPELFLTDVDESVDMKLRWFSQRVGIKPRHAHNMLIAAPTVFSHFDLKVLREGYVTLKSCGFTISHCRHIVASRPGLLALSRMEIRLKVWFWVTILKWDIKRIASCPAYLAAPFQDRILFRIALLDWNMVDLADVPLVVVFSRRDATFFRFINMKNIQVFRKWWKNLTLVSMIEAIRDRKYL